MDTQPSITDPPQPKDNPAVRGHLAFQDVTFTFPGSDEPALRHISFEARPGETTAIIGSTGAGKSALVNLIPRFYDVQQGAVLIDGVNVKDYDHAVLRLSLIHISSTQLRDRYGERITSRLMDRSRSVVFLLAGQDVRIHKKK